MPSCCSRNFLGSCRALQVGFLCTILVVYWFQSDERGSKYAQKIELKVETPSTPVPSETKVRVLCYGDSLTAGMSPPSRKLCPYTGSLRAALTENQTVDAKRSYQVDQIGLPGWTTEQFLKRADDEAIGLRGDLISHNSTTDVVILWGGTNDVIRLRDQDRAADALTDNLLRLHRLAVASGALQTIAVAIPPSTLWEHLPVAMKLVEEVNSRLRQLATLEPTMTFVPFPFANVRDGIHWSPDGLHLSCEGYDGLGRYLALTVLDIVQSKP